MLSIRICIAVAAVASVAAFAPVGRMGSAPARLDAPSFSPRLHSEAASGGGGNEFDDFAEFSSTQLTSSSDDSAGDGGDSFLSSLQSRVQQVQNQSNRLPLMILDTMLPRQILQIQIAHPTLKALMKHRVGQETPTLGMLGMATQDISDLGR